MKKKIEDFVRSINGTVSFSGKGGWTTAYVDHANGKDWIITECIKRFTRHSQIKFQ